VRYKSINQLNQDVVNWQRSLPSEIDLIVGIPRSGLLVANLLALHMHLPLTDVDGLEAGRLLGAGARITSGNHIKASNSALCILIVDDSFNTGTTMRAVAERFKGTDIGDKLMFGAIYVSPGSPKSMLDFWHEEVPLPRVFEWNILHHPSLSRACMDIDGVLCPDPTLDENDDGINYRNFLNNAPVTLVPSVEIGWLVTARLEKYRLETETWLAKSGIRYKELLMHPAATARERQAAADHAAFKARIYKQKRAWLFIESSTNQAMEIANLSQRPVYCTEARQMVYPGVAINDGAAPRRFSIALWHLQRTKRRGRTLLKRILALGGDNQ
jgi:orotate phosphoribosyltransferase